MQGLIILDNKIEAGIIIYLVNQSNLETSCLDFDSVVP